MFHKGIMKIRLFFQGRVMPLWARILLCVLVGIVLAGAVGVMQLPQESQLIPIAVELSSPGNSEAPPQEESQEGTSNSEAPPQEESQEGTGEESSLPVQQLQNDPNQKFVALTFDDGPGLATNDMLDLLASRGIHATFFVLGSCADKHPETVRRIVDEGHEIGTHTYSHTDLTTLAPEQIRNEIDRSQDAIRRASGGTSAPFLRPPGGCYNETVQQVCREEGLPLIMWSVDPKDWKHKEDAVPVIQNVLGGKYPVDNGSIVLMHDIYPNSVKAMETILDELQAQGYTFVTVSELLSANSGMTPGEAYRHG